MTSRREFLQIGVAASTLPLCAGAQALAPLADGDAGVDAVPLYKVLYDVRFPASVTFARRAAEWGVATQAMAGDMTRFWYDDLYHRWAQGPAAIAGLIRGGTATAGMIAKLRACEHALAGGVDDVVIVDGRDRDALVAAAQSTAPASATRITAGVTV